jgi:hypothetical protein
MADKSPMRVSVVDKGLGAMFARVSVAHTDAGVEVGVIEAEDPETALIAKVHEHGSEKRKIPQRSFLRSTVARNRERYVQLAKRAYSKFLDGNWSLVQALNAVGHEIKADIRRTIIKGIPPDLKKATISSKRRRGLPRPRTALYATGKLYEAIKTRLAGVR